MRPITEAEFWTRGVRTTAGCLEWTGAITSAGYGSLRRFNKNVSAHRLAYEFAFGTIPNGTGHHGVCVCHRCDNPLCIEPSHLFLGSHTDNMSDKASKGRSMMVPRGEAHYARKFTDAQIEEARRRVESGEGRTAVARALGMSKPHVDKIARGEVRRGP